MQLLENLPHDDAGTHRHVDGVFGAFLRQLDGTIAIGQGFLADAFHLVSKDICGLRLELEILQSHAAFHLLYSINPIAFKAWQAASVVAKWRHFTVSSAPKAVLWISRWGGQAVMPHKNSSPMRKASAVRKNAPTLLNERMLSSTIIIGVFSARSNSSLLRRFNSSVLSFRMFFSFWAQSK